MRADDERHGTSAGYIAGCRDACCWSAKQRYDKRRRWEALQGKPRKVSSLGAVRRVRALQARGWSVPVIAEHTGLDYRQLYSLHRYPTCYMRTFLAIAGTYEALAMKTPAAETTGQRISTVRARNNAARNGWPPPLAWDDIDDPEEQPTGWAYQSTDRTEAVRDFNDMGLGVTEVCRRLRMSRDALEKWCARRGMSDVYRKLAAREAVWENQHTRESA